MHETFVLATDLWRVLAPAYPETVQLQRHFRLSHFPSVNVKDTARSIEMLQKMQEETGNEKRPFRSWMPKANSLCRLPPRGNRS